MKSVHSYMVGLISILGFTFIGGLSPQSSQTTLVEHFTQSFVFDTTSANKESLTKTLIPFFTKKHINSLIGTRNGDRIMKRFKKGQIESQGNILLTFSLVSNRKSQFFIVKGFGSYNIIDKQLDKIYYSADFHIIEQQYPLAILNDPKATLEIHFRQILKNHIKYGKDLQTYALYSTEKIKLDFKIKHNLIPGSRKPRFTLNYDEKHEVSISGKPLGFLRFCTYEGQNDLIKIIDLSRRKSIFR